jgi:uncharacterized protein DUF4332
MRSELSVQEMWLYQALYNRATVASWQALEAKKNKDAASAKRQQAISFLTDLAKRLATRVKTLEPKDSKPVQKIKEKPNTPEATELEKYLRSIQVRERQLTSEDDRRKIRGLRQSITSLMGLIEMDKGPEASKPNLKFGDEVAGEGGTLAEINSRIHYELACYFSLASAHSNLSTAERQKCYELGFFHLGRALERPGDLNHYANVDPDLENLQTHAKARFKKIVNRFEESASPAAAQQANLRAVLEILGPQADVDTAEELLQAGKTPANRRMLSLKSDGKLSYDEITKWVQIADLMRLDNVNELNAKLLHTAGIVSPRALKEKTASSLFPRLLELNKKNQAVKRLPSTKSLSGWIKQAAKLDDVVD